MRGVGLRHPAGWVALVAAACSAGFIWWILPVVAGVAADQQLSARAALRLSVWTCTPPDEGECPDGRRLHRKSWVVGPGNRFTTRFWHTVERMWVDEVYEIGRDGALWLVETAYASNGAGLPWDAGEGRLILSPNGYRLVGLHRRMGRLDARLYAGSRYLVILGADSLDLSDLATGTAVRLEVRAESAWERLWRKLRGSEPHSM